MKLGGGARNLAQSAGRRGALLPTVLFMATTAGTAVTEEPPPYDRCDWHDGPSGTARLIRIIERSSGPSVSLRACAPCREQRDLTPLADIPMGEWLASIRPAA